MSANEYKVRIGKDKLLVYQPGPDRETDEEFVRQFEEASSSKPANLQEFFIRLAEIQKQSVHQNTIAMQIELKNIKVAEHLSEETTAFTADLYANNKKIAFVKNEGHGGNTHYQLYKQEDAPILRQTEEYCKNLPPAVYPETIVDGKPFTISMNLENYVDDLLFTYLKKKDLEKFHRKMAKHQEDSILFGAPDQQYQQWKFTRPIAEILRNAKGVEAIKKIIQEKVIPHLKEGEIILNTNLPPDLMQLERKKPLKHSSRIDDFPDKNRSRKR